MREQGSRKKETMGRNMAVAGNGALFSFSCLGLEQDMFIADAERSIIRYPCSPVPIAKLEEHGFGQSGRSRESGDSLKQKAIDRHGCLSDWQGDRLALP